MKHLSDFFAFSGDVGRINPEQSKLLKQDVHCPKVPYEGRGQTLPTMSKLQCALRIQEGNECTKNCPVAKRLIKKYNIKPLKKRIG